MSNNKQPTTSSIEQRVMDTIQSGQAHMRPRSYYLFLGGLGIIAATLLGVVTAYAMSVIGLWLRVQAATGPAYGVKRNLATLVDAFPWWALALGVASLVIMLVVVHRMGNLYKIRLLYLVPLIITLFLVLGFVFSYSSLPDTFGNQGGGGAMQGNGLKHGQSMK